jgi:O-antigen/teichoic acid export membrane protein
LATGILVARLLAPDDAGTVFYQLWLSSMIVLAASLGLPSALQRFSAALGEDEGGSASLAALAGVALAMAALASAALLLAARWQLAGLDIGSALPVAALVAVQGLETLAVARLSGRQRFAALARWSVASAALQVGAVALGAWRWGIAGALLGYAAGSLPLALAGLLAFPRSSAAPADPELGRRAWAYAMSAWVAALASALVWSRLELFFFAHYRSAAEAAQYGVALSWAAMAAQLPSMSLGALLPHFAARAGAGDNAGAFATYGMVTKLLGVVLVPLCLAGAALASIAIPMIYGQAFAPAVPCAMVLTAGGVLNLAMAGSSLLYGFERSRIMIVWSVVGALVFTALDWMVIPGGGLLAAAWTRILLQGALVAVGFRYISIRLACPVPLAPLARMVAAGCLCIAVPASMLASDWRIPLVALGMCAYVASLPALRLFTDEEMARISSACAALPGPLQVLPTLLGRRRR